MAEDLLQLFKDPLKFQRLCWPHVRFYDRQVEVIESVVHNDETIVPAGNMLGKDFVAGFIALWFFMSRTPCRIVTTSAKDDHLRVLWGEIGQFVSTSKIPLDKWLVLNHHDIRKVLSNGKRCDKSYLTGMVSNADKIASMQGHHLPRYSGQPHTMFIADEASSVMDQAHLMASTWMHRSLILGNTWPCTNFFHRGVKAGDLKAPDNGRYYRKIIRIKAEDSPNVRLAQQELKQGKKVSNTMLVPGVKGYAEYVKNRLTWDKVQQCVSLDAMFYEGSEVKLYPIDWLVRANAIAARLIGRVRKAKAMGVDTGEGRDSTVWTVVDELGILEQESMKTRDTAVILPRTINKIREWGLDPDDVLFDRGGGGQQHVDYLRAQGYEVRTVHFGETADDPHIYRRLRSLDEQRDLKEERSIYKNRRAEMYGLTREVLNPNRLAPLGDTNDLGFGIPAELKELMRQMEPLLLLFDGEGKMYLPPKDKPTPTYTGTTIKEMLGCSPDEADSLVLAVFAMLVKQFTPTVGAM